jgi:hypothetical protein
MPVKNAMRTRREADDRCVMLALSLAAYATETPLEDVLEADRGNMPVSRTRQIAMYICHVAFGMSIGRVARAFGRHNTTVAYACGRVEDCRDDAGFDAWMEKLETAACAAPRMDATITASRWRDMLRAAGAAA